MLPPVDEAPFTMVTIGKPNANSENPELYRHKSFKVLYPYKAFAWAIENDCLAKNYLRIKIADGATWVGRPTSGIDHKKQLRQLRNSHKTS